ncbi:MAG TPA: lasso peptide biosynthesis B2 protein [Gemmatimonadaceae bacterium]
MPAGRRRLARLMYAMLMVPRPALAVARMETVREWLDRLTARAGIEPVGEGDPLHTAHRTAALLNAVARYGLMRPNCLHRSLVLNCILSAQGIASEIRYGVRRRDGKFEAHAWVEHNGQPLMEPGDLHREYQPLRAVRELSSSSQP